MTLLDYLPSLHQAAAPRIDPAIWPLTATVDDLGRLCVGDVPLTDIADEFRTPTYVLDETDFRHRLQRYRADAAGRRNRLCRQVAADAPTSRAGWPRRARASTSAPAASWRPRSPAASIRRASSCTATRSRVDELATPPRSGVGRIVVDSLMEIAYLACEARRPQRVLIRVTPDIDIHGHAAVMTGVNDQKFGFTLSDGHAAEAVKRILHQPLLELVGLHCHIGSQITDPTLYGEAIRRMIATMADIRATHGVDPARTQHRRRPRRALRQRRSRTRPGRAGRRHRRRAGLGVRGGAVPPAAASWSSPAGRSAPAPG